MSLNLSNLELFIRSKKFLGFVTLVIVLSVWWINVSSLDARIAYSGFTPVEWNVLLTLPDHFAKDFPTGMAGYKTSLFMHLYPALASLLHVSVEAIMPWMIGLEVFSMAGAMIFLARTLFPDAQPVVLFSAAILVITGYLSRLDISMFGFANFLGLYYSAAEVFQLLAISASLRGKLKTAFACSILSTLIHPIIGIFSLVFILASGILGDRDKNWTPYGFGMLIFGLVVIPWFYVWTTASNFSGTTIPAADWYDLTSLCGAHWYPVSYGLFAGNPANFLYFLGYLLLFVHYAREAAKNGAPNGKVAAGVGAMLFLTFLGVFFSVARIHPSLIKLALHRSSGVVVLVGVPYVVTGLWREVFHGTQARAITAILLLISPFLLNPGFPLSLVLLLTWRTWWAGLKGYRGWYYKAAALLVLACLALLVTFTLNHYWQHLMEKVLKWKSYLAILLTIYVTLGLIYLVIARLFRRNFFVLASVVLLIVSSQLWLYRMRPKSSDVAFARSYKEVQLWARDQTPKDALFMVDPAIYYGWRAYSQRSSFGNLRDWLYNWAYSSDGSQYQEGLRRFGEFSIDYHNYLKIFPSSRGFDQLSDDVRKQYYRFDDEKCQAMARTYGIQYFVFTKKEIRIQSHFERVFENQEWLVLKVPDIHSGSSSKNK